MAKAAALFFIFACLLEADAIPNFKSYKLNTEGLVDSVVTYDLNGDGIDDIIIQTGKKLNIFFGLAGGEFKPNPDQQVQLTEDAFLWCIARVGDGPPSIVTNGSLGLYIYRQKGGVFSNPQELITVPNIFQGNNSNAPLYINFMPDLTNGGLSDALLFDKNTVLIFMQDKKGEFRLNQKLDINMDIQTNLSDYPIYPNESYITIPFFVVGDVDGDKKPDLLFYETQAKGEKIKIFLQGENNKFNYKDDLTIKLSEREEHKKGLLSPEIPPIIKDIDGDGILDVIVPYLKSGRIMIYLIKPGVKNYSTPNHIISVNGWIPVIWAEDFFGDGKKELVVSMVEKFKIAGAIEAFLTKKINVQLLAYPFADKGFDKLPVRTIKYSVPFVITLSKDTELSDSYKLVFKPNFDGDFNGDGIRDLLLLNIANKQLDVYYGNKVTILDEKPSAHINVNIPDGTDFIDTYATDINHDGVSDVIMKYTSIDNNSSQIEVIVSQK